ncbi:MAG: MGMT family protein [Verrucomicrobiota bacterium]|nr:MGMT family protein [Verrucomicrobiota bacterium]
MSATLPLSDFQNRVCRMIARIPRSRVSTYRLVAKALDCGSCRAVGQALRRNLWAPRVPCHRVIASDLTIGGFQGRRSGPALRLKRARLAREGVIFRNGKLADPTRLCRF